ncbi:hypothetical protein EB796_012628 [Bugula neritina]|uniref:Uncharacterized protein n=1 Tax=Bugula neritina TaxID=10212 RepID=A0A7J7JUN1_BUGNE|nr:hypothetical protein EB796_012628 [Bugula neritina]
MLGMCKKASENLDQEKRRFLQVIGLLKVRSHNNDYIPKEEKRATAKPATDERCDGRTAQNAFPPEVTTDIVRFLKNYAEKYGSHSLLHLEQDQQLHQSICLAVQQSKEFIRSTWTHA